ncbi:MAG: galactose mutarotase [Lachnospiraceae bacterium]|nr:galactose mutarotase [Lachnospiraceae bacterium]
MELLTRNITNKGNDDSVIYDITTNMGLSITFLTLGASIQKIAVKSADDTLIPIALGSPDLSFYERCACYAGATLAPNAGRIAKGLLPVEDETLQLSLNDGANQLHGGFFNLSSVNWQTEGIFQTNDNVSITMTAFQNDGTDGYPGNRHYQVSYSVEDTNWITIKLSATTDAPTYINMSNHTYWNLSGNFSAPGLEQTLTVFANTVCRNDALHLPCDLVPVAGTAFDFRKAHSLKTGVSYNHAYILNRRRPFRALRGVKRAVKPELAALLQDPVSGRTLEVMTDAPALVVYSGDYLADDMSLWNGQISCPCCAIALEAQDIPDVMHLLPSAYILTTPEQPFSRTIRYHVC